MGYEDVLWVYGHPNIKATHRSTLEFTKDPFCTPRGDCILGVKASKSVADLNEELKAEIKRGRKVWVRISCGELTEELYGFGSSKLTLTDLRSIVIRKSRFVDPSTLMINANKSAGDVNRRLVRKMMDPDSKALVEIFV